MPFPVINLLCVSSRNMSVHNLGPFDNLFDENDLCLSELIEPPIHVIHATSIPRNWRHC